MNMDKTISHLNGLLQERDQLILQKEQMEKEMQRQKSLTDLFMEGLKKTQKEVQTLTETVKTERKKIQELELEKSETEKKLTGKELMDKLDKVIKKPTVKKGTDQESWRNRNTPEPVK
jgi:hypothetical protein